jgi:hypothetical protein
MILELNGRSMLKDWSELSVDMLEKRQVKITNDLIPWFFDESLLVIIVLFFQYDEEICYYIEYY